MANLTADRVKETTTTTGTGTITLLGAVAQFRSFASAFADGNVVQYAIVDQTGTEWEVGNGTFTASGTTLARTTVLASSNANAAVNLGAGTKDVFATATADHMLNPVFTRADVDNLRLDGNTISSTDTNGNINLTPNGAGQVIAAVGSGATPAYAFTGAAGSGMFFIDTGGGSGGPNISHNGVVQAKFDNYNRGVQVGSTSQFSFGGLPIPYASIADTGLARASAGVVKGTDGNIDTVRFLQGGGPSVASAAALPAPTGRVCHVTGTVNITSIVSINLQSGVVVTLIFDDILTVTDGGNLKLAGNFVTAADSTLSLVYDGTNWFETSRSTN